MLAPHRFGGIQGYNAAFPYYSPEKMFQALLLRFQAQFLLVIILYMQHFQTISFDNGLEMHTHLVMFLALYDMFAT